MACPACTDPWSRSALGHEHEPACPNAPEVEIVPSMYPARTVLVHLNIAVPEGDQRTPEAMGRLAVALLSATAEFASCTVEAPLAEEA